MATEREQLTGLPNWVNVPCIDELLRNCMSDVKKLKNYEIEPITKEGEVPAVFRLNCVVLLREDNRSALRRVILKTTLNSQKSQTKFSQLINRLRNERAVYDEFLPEFSKLCSALKFERKFACARLSIIEVGPHLSMYFEDLPALGYVQPDFKEGMANEQIEALLKKLSTLHAASVCANQRGLQCIAEQHTGLLGAKTSEYIASRCVTILNAIKDELEASLRRYKRRYLEAMPNAERFGNELRRLFERDVKTAGFCVFNQGEPWAKNVWLKYQKNAISEVIFGDYQLSHYGPPTYDLYLVLVTCANKFARFKIYRHLKIYAEGLRESLTKLKYSGVIPRFDELQKMMVNDRYYALFFAVTYLPLLVMPPDWRYTLDDLMENDDAMRKLISTEAYRNEFRWILEDLILLKIPD